MVRDTTQFQDVYIEFGISTSNNVGDMHRKKGTDGQCNCYMPPKVSLLEHSSILLTLHNI